MVTKIYKCFLMMNIIPPLLLQSLPVIGQDNLTLEKVNELFETPSNWGRWGCRFAVESDSNRLVFFS